MSAHNLKPGEKCCCGWEPPKPPPPPKPKVNNLQTNGLMFCCGAMELGNFNYDDPPDAKSMTHYHRVDGGWKTQSKHAERTTKAEIEERLRYAGSGAVLCTTGVGQEYLEPILTECGFDHVSTFRNPGHAGTNVKLWCKVLHKPV